MLKGKYKVGSISICCRTNIYHYDIIGHSLHLMTDVLLFKVPFLSLFCFHPKSYDFDIMSKPLWSIDKSLILVIPIPLYKFWISSQDRLDLCLVHSSNRKSHAWGCVIYINDQTILELSLKPLKTFPQLWLVFTFIW
jgi:hypothetical protein